MDNGTHQNLLHEKILTRIINKVCIEVLFIHAHVTLEYFNFKRENGFKRIAVYFYCFGDNYCRATAEGNGSDPHLNRHDHSFLQRLAQSLSAFLL